MPILKKIGNLNLGIKMETRLNEILNELNLENSLQVISITDGDSHNKKAICNSEDWKNNIHLSIFDNYLATKYQNKSFLLLIDSARENNNINLIKIKNFKNEFISQNFLFDSVGSGFVIDTFTNNTLSVDDTNKIKSAINILTNIYDESSHHE